MRRKAALVLIIGVVALAGCIGQSSSEDAGASDAGFNNSSTVTKAAEQSSLSLRPTNASSFNFLVSSQDDRYDVTVVALDDREEDTRMDANYTLQIRGSQGEVLYRSSGHIDKEEFASLETDLGTVLGYRLSFPVAAVNKSMISSGVYLLNITVRRPVNNSTRLVTATHKKNGEVPAATKADFANTSNNITSCLQIENVTTFDEEKYGEQRYRVTGIVQNTCDKHLVEFVGVDFALFNDEGNVITTSFTYTSPSDIPAHYTAPFEESWFYTGDYRDIHEKPAKINLLANGRLEGETIYSTRMTLRPEK